MLVQKTITRLVEGCIFPFPSQRLSGVVRRRPRSLDGDGCNSVGGRGGSLRHGRGLHAVNKLGQLGQSATHHPVLYISNHRVTLPRICPRQPQEQPKHALGGSPMVCFDLPAEL